MRGPLLVVVVAVAFCQTALPPRVASSLDAPNAWLNRQVLLPLRGGKGPSGPGSSALGGSGGKEDIDQEGSGAGGQQEGMRLTLAAPESNLQAKPLRSGVADERNYARNPPEVLEAYLGKFGRGTATARHGMPGSGEGLRVSAASTHDEGEPARTLSSGEMRS
jgi:hypothetical protein